MLKENRSLSMMAEMGADCKKEVDGAASDEVHDALDCELFGKGLPTENEVKMNEVSDNALNASISNKAAGMGFASTFVVVAASVTNLGGC